MRKMIARAALARFGKRYDYDTSYMDAMLEAAPEAFFKFAKIMDAAQHRQAAPQEAYHAAKIVAALSEDCGPCTQLTVDFAREAHVADAQIEAVLRRAVSGMNEATALGFRFAEAVVYRLPGEEDVRDAVRAAWGEKAVIELSLAIATTRVFPTLKAGMGYAKECRRIRINARDIDVMKRAA